MAATIETRPTAKILPFRAPGREVAQTDRKNRLPTLSADEVDSFFDLALTRLAA